jgi:hypothetical protein
MSTYVSSKIGRSHSGDDATKRVSRNDPTAPQQAPRTTGFAARPRGFRRRSTSVAMATLGSLLLTSVAVPVASAAPLSFTQQDFQPQSITDQAPALGLYGGYEYFAWKGKSTDKVFYSDDNARCGPPGQIQLGSCWSHQATVSGPWGTARTLDAPALVGYDRDLYAFWTGETDNRIWYSVYNGKSWSKQELVSSAVRAPSLVLATDQSPTVTVYDSELYVAWDDNTDFFFAKFNGSSWVSEPFISSILGSPPALVGYGGDLYALWAAESGNAISFMAYNGDKWSTPETLSGSWGTALTDGAAAVTVCNRDLYVAWKGERTTRIWYSDFNGSSWASQQVVAQALTNRRPALGASGDDLYVSWKGQTHDKVGFVEADVAPSPPK